MPALNLCYSPLYSVYKAVELCAFELYDEIDYDRWFQSQLVRELQIRDPRYNIICAEIQCTGRILLVSSLPHSLQI